MEVKEPTTADHLYTNSNGTGPVVALLQGMLVNGTIWTEVVDALRDDNRCIVPERTQITINLPEIQTLHIGSFLSASTG